MCTHVLSYTPVQNKCLCMTRGERGLCFTPVWQRDGPRNTCQHNYLESKSRVYYSVRGRGTPAHVDVVSGKPKKQNNKNVRISTERTSEIFIKRKHVRAVYVCMYKGCCTPTGRADIIIT